MRWLPVLLSVISLFLHGCNARQFEHWYPFYEWTLTQEEGAPTCLKDYADAVERLGAEQSMTCKNLVSCIYNNTKEIDKADMSSALVLLGLAPTVLGQMGPTLNQKAQLCVQSPILGLLCVLGAPSIAFGMPWARTTPITPTDANAFASGEMWFFNWIIWAFNRIFCGRMEKPAQQTKPMTQSIWIILAKYSLAVGAAVNLFLNVWTLSRQTVVSWKCTSVYLEFLWVSLTLVPIFLAVVATSVERTESTRSGSKGRPLWSRIFYSLSNIAGAVHVLFGTVMFSSVLFIGTLDALGVVGRLTASTLVCQFITALELERTEDTEQELKNGQGTEHELQDVGNLGAGSNLSK
ncbi:uncharacterized protein N7487_010552 [Penicillium crustosum]|uniref:uncharacterized protein n=1 Tax=Penicillium crustosum TaxID=36656 RepID=UPI0023A020CF|nr:uncharacterized protein N7487_010552 [Penicillium crustosum]KAJ5396249.1 hypothetical protein N7487_010552 [Penicillium crustosum]